VSDEAAICCATTGTAGRFLSVSRTLSTVVTLLLLTGALVVAERSPRGEPSAGGAPDEPAGIALTAVPVAAVGVTPAMAPSRYEARVQAWVNTMRRRHGLRPLRFARCPDASAERWAAWLARHDRFRHQSMTRLLRRCNARYAGETLARGVAGPAVMVTLWMQSPPHRRILLSPKPRRIGVGAVPNRHGAWVVAANFIRF
jgi:uncharacterized protein YkwD